MAALTLGDFGSGWRFLYSLISTPSRPIRLTEARASLGARLAGREQDFLALVDAAVCVATGAGWHPRPALRLNLLK